MNVIKSALLILFVSLIYSAYAENNIQNYQKAFDSLYLEYNLAYVDLNKEIEKCSLGKRTDFNFTIIARRLPNDLSKPQLNAALFLMKKQHNDKCSSAAAGYYLSKAADMKLVISTIRNDNLSINSTPPFDAIINEINNSETQLFSVPNSYLKSLAEYESISAADRKKIESIEELKSDYNIVKLLDALPNKSQQ